MNWKEETKMYSRIIENAKEDYQSFKKRNPQWNKLYEFAERNGYLTAPTSTKWHGCFKGGNLVHSSCVADTLLDLCQSGLINQDINFEDISFIGYFHDLCKIDQYIFNEDGTISWNDKANPAHAKKSIEMIENLGIELNPRVKNAIRYHMGPYEKKEYDWAELGNVQKEDRLVMLTHFADVYSSQYLV